MADLYRLSSPHLLLRQSSSNPLLLKDDVGRAKPSYQKHPPSDYTFGQREVPVEGGVREALTWAVPEPSKRRQPLETDFQRLNKSAARNRVTSPKGLAEFRSAHEFPLLPRSCRSPPKVIPSDVIPGWAYGEQNRPSTPIAAIMSHQYGNEKEEALVERYRKYMEEREKLRSPLKIRFTRAARLARHRPEGPEAQVSELWKMSKFKKVPSKVGPTTRPSTSLPLLALDEHDAKDIDATDIALEPGEETEDEQSTETTERDQQSAEATEKTAADQADQPPEAWIEPSQEPLQQHAKSKYTWSPVKLKLTIAQTSQFFLQTAMQELAACIRREFPCFQVKLGDFAVEDPRQALRERRDRYVAWGQGALGLPTASGVKVLSVVVMSLLIRHEDLEELRHLVGSVMECITSHFMQGVVVIQDVLPRSCGAVPRPEREAVPQTPPRRRVRRIYSPPAL